MYGLPPNTADAYLYSPAFAQLIWPLAQLPWPLFVAAGAVAGFALYAWLLRPLGRTLAPRGGRARARSLPRWRSRAPSSRSVT